MSRNRLSGNLEELAKIGVTGLATLYVKRMILLLVILILALLVFGSLTGCYMIDKTMVGTEVGVIIANSTPLALEIVENGEPLRERLLPGDHLVIRVRQEFENKTETIHVLAKAWSLDGTVFAGAVERTFYVSHHYSAHDMSYSMSGKQSWIVRSQDLCR
jgi:hypothetical protein